MIDSVQVHAEGDAVVVSIPFKLRRRSGRGRKLIVAGNRPTQPIARQEHATVLKALGRAYRWKWMLESGEFASIGDLASAEKINHSYLRRILRLTLLSPKITGAVLDGRQVRHLHLESLLTPFPHHWAEQVGRFK